MIEPLEINFKAYAMTDNKSRGRKISEEVLKGDFRTEFQHDRDRIIHSKSFRRLESKTQVVISQESDHNRKRLTHSLEVMQMADSIAYALGANIFLTQAIALGHDLGHAPFGHRGEKTLNAILKDHDLPGFKHNYQSLLIVNKLESGYRDSVGLNLMYETRDGILKHTSIKDDIPINYFDHDLDNGREYPVTIEGQIIRVVDEIAQRSHDTDDGLRTHRIDVHELLKQKIMKEIMEFNKLKKEDLITDFKKDDVKVISKIVVAIIKYYINDVVETSLKNIHENKILDYQDVCNNDILLVDFSKAIRDKDTVFQKNFLQPNFYSHYEVKRMDSRGNYFIRQLFKAFKKSPGQLPVRDFEAFEDAVADDLSRNEITFNRVCSKEGCIYKAKQKYISDEISGEEKDACPLQKKKNHACDGIRALVNAIANMTDRHANLEYSRLYLPPEISRV